MKNWKSMLAILSMIALAATATAAVDRGIGVYFDEGGHINDASFVGGFDVVHDAYICVTNAELMVAGASFRLTMDPQILLLTATFPAGLAIGEVTSGVDVGMSHPLPAFFGDAVIVCTLQLTTLGNLMDHAELVISNHPNYLTPVIADSLGNLYDAVGGTSYLSIPVGTEDKSWSEVKALFQ